jgi:hypothetical protein
MPSATFCTEIDPSSLIGITVDAYAQHDGYWHLFVALRDIGGDPLVFTTVEMLAGPRFDVFPIAMAREATSEHVWRALPHAIVIQNATALRRNEWAVRGAVHATLGEDPWTHHAGRGPASLDAIVSARVLAGVLIEGLHGEKMVIASSDSAPFNVEIFLPGQAAEQALERFEVP